MRTIREACIRGTEILRQNGIPEAELDAWYLLEHVTGISRALYFRTAAESWKRNRKSDILKKKKKEGSGSRCSI